MTTAVTFTFVSRCTGGGHTALDVSVGGAALGRFVYTTDEIRAALATLTQQEREAAALAILKLHFAGQTRAQIVTAFGSPVTVTI